ncbi:hypothetical protein DIURU_005580 [Diutina rugosa]|uniref:PQ-loop-domain-containing protein n=1 Tax=Diutina rugosa TaxID=5481 RepID=A0A642UCT2_DIURU|nr:uncharacterized protein DIURU_005580 [Diutina rugosa]KAA8896840.1 hypothetical protein DIURU_005580 [Diutina rugosa]
MPPPIAIDAHAISGITGSISIACWVIVFAPQIYENYVRKSSSGLSLSFVVLWLAGDVFNVLGSVLQGVLPTMIILAVYYTLADIVLLWQCLVYGDGGEKTDGTHLSPATPMHEDTINAVLSDNAPQRPSLKDGLTKVAMVMLVFLAGVIGWLITDDPNREPDQLVYDPLAQFFGWLCAILYLGSRIPQILLNYKRKSVDGISFMFFLFACLGNLTYVISILAIDTSWYYLWVNSSWLAGSLGTLAMDFTIFIQFFIYNENEPEVLITNNAANYGGV